MPPRTPRPAPAARRAAPTARHPASMVLRGTATTNAPRGMPVLLAAGAFPAISSTAVSNALARGLQQRGLAAPMRIELTATEESDARVRALLEREHFDAQLHGARAVVIAVSLLQERTLAGSAAFEIATRARQAGVPAYAIAARSTLNAFDARMLDLQLVLEARSARSLARAAGALAQLLLGRAG